MFTLPCAEVWNKACYNVQISCLHYMSLTQVLDNHIQRILCTISAHIYRISEFSYSQLWLTASSPKIPYRSGPSRFYAQTDKSDSNTHSMVNECFVKLITSQCILLTHRHLLFFCRRQTTRYFCLLKCSLCQIRCLAVLWPRDKTGYPLLNHESLQFMAR